ncbi:MAG: formate hydrogenlyase [Peptococcaceae bacterium]|nr:formate hydrogenlyase [Peptococcaceae bacterium]
MTSKIAIVIGQLLFVMALAPLLSGVIKKTKASFQTRQGPGFLQVYRDIYKWFHKDSVISEHTSWIFIVTPYIYFSALFVAALLIPTFTTVQPLGFAGDVIAVIYLFALGRFFMSLAGLDAGSAFGGMASSREAAVSSVIEPAMMLAIFSVALVVGSTNLGIISETFSSEIVFNLSHILAFMAMAVVTVAETGRIPVDNPDTHLELTMVHEGMLLEYSGKELALMMWGASIKQLLVYSLLVNVFFPIGIANNFDFISILIGLLSFISKVFFVGIIVAVIETSFVKMRFFKIPDLLAGAFMLGLLSLVSNYVLGR